MLGRALRVYKLSFSGLPPSLWLLSGIAFVNRAGTMVLPFLILYLTRDRGFSAERAGVILAVYGAGSVLGSYLGGWLTDRFGSRAGQQIGLFGGGAGFVTLGFMQAPVAIAAVVFLTAVFADAFRPAALAAASEYAPPGEQARSFALLRFAINAGWAVGPSVGGLLAAADYRWLFLVDGGTCWLAGCLLFTLRPAVGMTAQTSSTASGPSPWRDPFFVKLTVFSVFVGAVFFQFFSTFPLSLHDLYGLNEARIGILLGLNAAMVMIFEMPIVWWAKRFRPMRAAAAGVLLICIGFGSLPLGSTIAFVALSITIWSAGEMLTLPMLLTAVSERAPAGARGRYIGGHTMGFSLALLFAPTTGTAIYARYGATVWWGVVAALGPLLALGALWIARSPRPSPAIVAD